MITNFIYIYTLFCTILTKTTKMHKKISIESTTYKDDNSNMSLKLCCNALKTCV
jgi:hypothetical protein